MPDAREREEMMANKSRLPDSVQHGGFGEPHGIPPEEVSRVLEELPLRDESDPIRARRNFELLLSEYATRRMSERRAKPKAEVLATVVHIRGLFRSAAERGNFIELADYLRVLKGGEFNQNEADPVTFQRVRWALDRPRITDSNVLATLEDPDSVLAQLEDEIRHESARGRPEQNQEIWLVNRLFDFWKNFTGKGTITKARSSTEPGPFVEFAQSTVRLFEPEFLASHTVRIVHERRMEARKSQPSRD